MEWYVEYRRGEELPLLSRKWFPTREQAEAWAARACVTVIRIEHIEQW